MNSKDKEKLKMCAATMSILPSETIIIDPEDYSNDALYQTLLKYVEEKGVKNGYVMWPIRTAVSGKQMTPGGATELMEVLGREETCHRIRVGIEMLEKALGEQA